MNLRGVFDEPSHLFGRDLVRGNDEVSLVLASFVVHNHEEFTPREGSEGFLHVVEFEALCDCWCYRRRNAIVDVQGVGVGVVGGHFGKSWSVLGSGERAWVRSESDHIGRWNEFWRSGSWEGVEEMW